jgi:hypothetical protein
VPPTLTSEAPTPESNTAYDQAAQFEGEWVGVWTNNTFGSTGDVTVTIIVGTDGTGIFLVDLGGLVFGTVDPPEMRYEGTYTLDGALFEAAGDPLFGDLTITINSAGEVSILGDLIPIDGIARLEASGTISLESMDLHYVVLFPGGGQADGVFTLARP